MSWDKTSSSYSPSNQSTLDKLSDNGAQLLFNGQAIGTGAGTSTSKWTGKTWNVIGDSITEHNFRTSENYQDYIATWIGCTVNNYGVSGTGYFTPSSSGGTNQIPNRISAMSSTADLITVFAGTNDWGQVGKTLVMGSLGDTDPNASFYGAVDNTITQLQAKYPLATIAVFTPLPRNNNQPNGSTTTTLSQLSDAIIAVCKKYSIPVLDLNRNASPLNPFNSTNNNTYFKDAGGDAADGLHPNATGHQILANKILAFLNGI